MEKIIVFKQRFASASLTPVVHNGRVAMRLSALFPRPPPSGEQRRRVPQP